MVLHALLLASVLTELKKYAKFKFPCMWKRYTSWHELCTCIFFQTSESL